ncbi:MAG: hypothetical protein K2M00_06040, partial [Muribaculaceae bacterium]|nr:hypothetical protein [Muribaculaceae bacterium]
MNKKFIKVLLLAAVCGAGCATFTSCKDNLEDLRDEVKVADADLQLKLDKLSDELNALKTAQEACKTECQQKIADLLARLGVAEDQIATMSGQINNILTELGTKVTADQVRTIIDSYGFLTSADLDGYVKTDDLTQILTDIANLTITVNQLTLDLGSLTTLVNTLDSNYNQLIQDLQNGVYND